MRRIVVLSVALGVAVSASAFAQAPKPGEQTWKGKISDSNCKDKHPGGEHDGKKMTDADCTTVCVKKGAKYVFVSDGKVYQLDNQSSKQIASPCRSRSGIDGRHEGRQHQRQPDQDAGREVDRRREVPAFRANAGTRVSR